jgi:hypothetical protein
MVKAASSATAEPEAGSVGLYDAIGACWGYVEIVAVMLGCVSGYGQSRDVYLDGLYT